MSQKNLSGQYLKISRVYEAQSNRPHSMFRFYVCITSLVLLNTDYKNSKVCTTVSCLQVCISASDTIHRNWQLLHFHRVSLTESIEGKIPSSLTLLRSTTQACGHLLLDSNTKHAQNKTKLLPCQTQWNNTHQSQYNFTCTYLTNWCLFFCKRPQSYTSSHNLNWSG